MAHLKKRSSGHLGKHSNGHLGGGFLFNIKEVTVTWDGYITEDSNGTEYDAYHNMGGSLERETASALTDAESNISFTGPVFGRGMRLVYYGPDDTSVIAGQRNRMVIQFGWVIDSYGGYIVAQTFYSPESTDGAFTSPVTFTDSLIAPTSSGTKSFTYTGISNVQLTIDSTW